MLISKTPSEIRRRRLALGLTQEEAALAADLSFKAFARSERVPRPGYSLTKIAAFFGCRPEELLAPVAAAAQDAK